MSRFRPFEGLREIFLPGKEQRTQELARQTAQRAITELMLAHEQHIARSLSPNQHFPDFTLNDILDRGSGHQVIRLDGVYLDTYQQLKSGYKWFVIVRPAATGESTGETMVFPIETSVHMARLDVYANLVPQVTNKPPTVLPQHTSLPDCSCRAGFTRFTV